MTSPLQREAMLLAALPEGSWKLGHLSDGTLLAFPHIGLELNMAVMVRILDNEDNVLIVDWDGTRQP